MGAAKKPVENFHLGISDKSKTISKKNRTRSNKFTPLLYAGSKYGCDYCAYTSDHKMSLTLHHNNAHGEKTWVCTWPFTATRLCNKVLSNESSLKRHRREVHLKIKIRCKLCSKMISQSNLGHHIKKMHTRVEKPEEPRTCPWKENCQFSKCYQVITEEGEPTSKFLHHGQRSKRYLCLWFGCKISGCRKWYSGASGLKYHIDPERFQCGWTGCTYEARRKSEVTKHKKSKHPKASLTDRECPVCRLVLCRPDAARKHLGRIHSIFQCGSKGCPLEFDTAELRDFHKEQSGHQGKRPRKAGSN